MSTPVGSRRSISSPVHHTAADALASLIAQGEAWPPESPQRFRNVLLDACGSDHRPLIELLLRVGRHGIADALRALGPVPALVWPTKRTTLVSRACGELFIGAEIAGWAVDAWAVALGVVPRSSAQALQVEYAASATRARQRADGATAATLRPARAAASALQPATTPAAGGSSNARTGAWTRGAAAAIVAAPQWRVSASSVPVPDLTRFFRALAVAGVIMLAAVVWQRTSAIDARPAGDTLATAAAAFDTLPGSAAAVVPDALPTSSAAAAFDTVPGSSASATPSTQSAVVQPIAEASADTVMVPSVLPVTTSDNVRAAGVGGTYVVQQRILSVGGDALCDPLADALSRRVLQSQEEFTHTADSTHFVLASRPGVSGIVQSDGVFATAPYRGTHDGVRFVFQMSGRFTPAGFIARSVTETDAVIRYRRQQRCVVVADLIGSRATAVNTPE